MDTSAARGNIQGGTPSPARRSQSPRALGGRAVIAAMVAVAGLGGLGGVAGWWGNSGAKGTESTPQDCGVARRQGFKITTTCSGRLEARRQIEIRSKLDSRSTIVELAPEGKFVKAGELLIRLNTDELGQSIREEQLALETSRAESVAASNGVNIQVNENGSKLRQAESKLKLAKLALQQWEQGEVKKKKQELELAIEKTASDLSRLVDKVETSRRLNEKGFLSKDELQMDQIALTAARSAAKSAEMDSEIYWSYKHPEEKETRTSAAQEAESELERVKLNNEIELAGKESAAKTKAKQLEIHEARLKELQKQVEEASIRAPVDGLVVYAFSMGLGWRETPLQIGQPVYRNELVMILPDTSEMTAAVGIQESLSSKVKEGQEVDVKVDAAGRTFRGKVESLGVIAASDDGRDRETREYKVKVGLDPAAIKGVELKPSMRVDATITLGEVAEALAIPVQAVFNDGPLRYVYELRGGGLVRTPIQVGRLSSSMAEVTGGLGEGATVLLRDPRPGEYRARPWDQSQVGALGYDLDADGRPMARTAVKQGDDTAPPLPTQPVAEPIVASSPQG